MPFGPIDQIMSLFLAELIGTTLLLLLGNGVVANVVLDGTKGEGAGWIAITFGWGTAVFVAVFTVAGVSGAHINPAVTLGLAVAGKFPWAEVPMYIAAQMIGAAHSWKARQPLGLRLDSGSRAHGRGRPGRGRIPPPRRGPHSPRAFGVDGRMSHSAHPSAPSTGRRARAGGRSAARSAACPRTVRSVVKRNWSRGSTG